MHPTQLVATIYHALGINPHTLVMNHLNQPRELVQSERGHEEMGNLVNAITTNLTSFFREPHHFEHLRDTVLPEIKNKRLRLWSAGCSTGEEPYSLAILLQQLLPDWRNWRITLLATALSYYGYRVSFPKVNTPPTIGSIADRTINANSSTGAIAFTVGRTRAGFFFVDFGITWSLPYFGEGRSRPPRSIVSGARIQPAAVSFPRR